VPTRIYTYRSLGVEEQFYFLFPGMLLAMYPQHVLKAVGRGSKAASQPETLEAEVSSASSGCGGRPMMILGLSALLSLVAYIVAVRLAFPGARDDKFWFYNTPFRFWELASGALLYLGLSLHPDAFAPIQQAVCVSLPQTTTPSPLSPLPSPLSPGPRLPPCPHPSFKRFSPILPPLLPPTRCNLHPSMLCRHPQVTSGIAFVLYALAFALASESEPNLIAIPWSLVSTVATLLFILAGSPHPHPHPDTEAPRSMNPPVLNWICSTEPMRWIGRISYQLYLWHYPAIIFSTQVQHNLARAGNVPPLVVLLAVVGTALVIGVAMPLFSYYAVEGPLRKWRCTHNVAVATMLGLIVFTCVFIQVLRMTL
jgi:peptidoglycan/LPS O-acetylase OafA/YrhL